MGDQAQGLRELVRTNQLERTHTTRIITVTSGKGGVGKSNFTLNFALTLQARGFRVLVFDADIGLANIDVLMGVSPKYTLYHLLKQEKTIWDIIQTGSSGLQYIAGGSGFHDLIRLNDQELDHFVGQIDQLNGYVDFIIFDTGAGLSKETLRFILAAEETVVVTTPEPTSITDAYAIIKMVQSMNYSVHFQLVVNRVVNSLEGKQTSDKISLVAKKFLNLEIPLLGYVAEDTAVSKAVKKQIPFTIAYPNSPASKGIEGLVDRFVSEKPSIQTEAEGFKGFINKMLRLLK